MKKGLKGKRKREKSGKSREKNFNFFLFTRFYTERINVTNKSCLFDAKFFEFEEFSIVPFFYSSIQPQHAVVEDFNSFSTMFYYIINTTYQKIGDLFCPAHISGLSQCALQLPRTACYER